ncbi:PR domain zinc finger protein 10-like isoform X1 [Sinocyclocheilus rhinocerous]|uniref:PR domain zinc finger protein 10-like isoform X1 n=1 Tax=Sinocyclocheilus rhinocerous TaxID=307959 RepID=UPI0007BAD8BE|nr:PREDICTED: PR domain zinc finger protein 10-like isoform X1 [Sinocyclocheilus rhinocerous]
MEAKQESTSVWSSAPNNDTGNTPQVHFEASAVAQIVYSGEQSDHTQQQVVYTADGSSYTSVESAEHTLVYIHPADGTQAVFTDQPQVAYIQQDGTTQQVTVLLPSGQNMNTANLHVLSNVADGPQAILEPVAQSQLAVTNAALPNMPEASSSPLGATDSTVDSEDEEEDNDSDDSEMDDWEPRTPQPFTPQNLWCEDCNNANLGACMKHGPLHPILNRPVMSKARASLPLVLYIDRFLDGVFTKRRIPKRTQFGPIEGPLVRQSELQDTHIHLKLYMLDPEKEGERAEDLWFDLSNEERCNWMMFVRPAQNHMEQNLVAYQYGSDIFYTTIKNIQPKQELKVWYAASYAEFVNQKVHDVTDEERKVLREQEKNWPCYECNRRFMSSEQLQQHLNMHDDKLNLIQRPKGRGRGRGRKRFGAARRPGRRMKFICPQTPVESADKTQELLASVDKLPFEERTDGALNGLKVVEMAAESMETETEEGLDTPATYTEELQEEGDSVTPSLATEVPGSAKEDLSQTSPEDPHLTPQDMRRARRIRNAALQHLFIRKSFRPFKCSQCGKAFRDKDKLDQHMRYHGRDGCRHMCHQCGKGFLTNAALEDHRQLHCDQRIYSCLFCAESYDRLDLLKVHVEVHLVNGCFSCPSCKKTFTDFIQVKKHVRSFHSEKIFQCTECDKAFCRPDKLRLHMLRHSDRKDFLCSACGKQFKRKDKLREHMQRMHNPEREAKKDHIHRTKALKQKEPTTDFESFMFKCRLCMMGFRRRGMLVNHLSKRHPEMRLEEVPELTLPIIKPNRDYFCQYCDKVYKSASKRKAHILKNHPGAELPPSIRKLRPAGPGEPDPMLSTHTQLTGTIATAPVCCPHCAKQYSSKTKMVQHIRKKHPEYQYNSSSSIQAPLAATVISSTPAVITTDGTTAEAVVTTDLLTQAMTELSQTLTTDYRTAQGDFQRIQYIPVSQAGGGLSQPQHIQLQVVQVAPASSPHAQHSTVDVSQLHDPHSYSQHSIQVQHIQVAEPTGTVQANAQVSAQPLSPSSQQAAQELSSAQLTPVTLAQGQPLQTSTSQTQGAAQHAYLPSNWNYRSYPAEIQMMALPHTQYVIAEASAPVTAAVNSSQVKTTHYVISEGQTELDGKQVNVPSTAAQVHPDPLEQLAVSQQTTTQYIITTTTNGTGASEVHITKP